MLPVVKVGGGHGGPGGGPCGGSLASLVDQLARVKEALDAGEQKLNDAREFTKHLAEIERILQTRLHGERAREVEYRARNLALSIVVVDGGKKPRGDDDDDEEEEEEQQRRRLIHLGFNDENLMGILLDDAAWLPSSLHGGGDTNGGEDAKSSSPAELKMNEHGAGDGESGKNAIVDPMMLTDSLMQRIQAKIAQLQREQEVFAADRKTTTAAIVEDDKQNNNKSDIDDEAQLAASLKEHVARADAMSNELETTHENTMRRVEGLIREYAYATSGLACSAAETKTITERMGEDDYVGAAEALVVALERHMRELEARNAQAHETLRFMERERNEMNEAAAAARRVSNGTTAPNTSAVYARRTTIAADAAAPAPGYQQQHQRQPGPVPPPCSMPPAPPTTTNAAAPPPPRRVALSPPPRRGVALSAPGDGGRGGRGRGGRGRGGGGGGGRASRAPAPAPAVEILDPFGGRRYQ